MSNDDTKDMVETVDVSPRDPDLPQAPGGDVFRQLLHQAVRVADMANSQAMRMALDFAKVYEREQGVRAQFENQLKQMTLMEKQATRYAEDLAGMLRSERERRQELERALEQERIASEELRRTGLQGISHLLLAATIKDRTTGTHLQRVRRYVEAIAERLGLQSALVEEFGYSSGIDGEKMLGTARFFETARAIAREHHERWDGKGYPDGKKGEEISLAARIVSIADVYDALTSKRPYKEAWSAEAGLKAIEAGAGERFDPEIVGGFIALAGEGVLERISSEVAASEDEDHSGSSAK